MKIKGITKLGTEDTRRPNGAEINKFRENSGAPTVAKIHKIVKSQPAPTGRK
jgi:hypothetical protein